jgi:hypothetical protein
MEEDIDVVLFTIFRALGDLVLQSKPVLCSKKSIADLMTQMMSVLTTK